jgi:hypothetical protein
VQFGTQAQYLIDFCHLCDYLSAAAQVIAGNDKPDWMEEKKDWLKDNRWEEVLEAVRPFLEQAHIPDPDAPVRACFRYISNHSNFLDYKGALAAGFPIGSGEIESGHRYVFQTRLKKIAGGKPKKDGRYTRIASERRLGRLLQQRALESCITDSHFQLHPRDTLRLTLNSR